MDIKKKSIIKKCDYLSIKFLEIAREFNTLSKSTEKTTDKKTLNEINNILEKRVNALKEYFRILQNEK